MRIPGDRGVRPITPSEPSMSEGQRETFGCGRAITTLSFSAASLSAFAADARGIDEDVLHAGPHHGSSTASRVVPGMSDTIERSCP